MPQIIPEQAEVVRDIYDRFLSGQSIRMIREDLESRGIRTSMGSQKWSDSTIRSILKNEVYCGDVLRQKTFVRSCIDKKVIRNTGQLPMYLTRDHHEGIVDRDTYNAVQSEFARRNAGRADKRKSAPTGRTCYSAKYALTERLVCGECGTLYRRVSWRLGGKKYSVWRCISRLDYGSKYCKGSPTLFENPLRRAILAAINSVMSQKSALVDQIADAMRMELLPLPGGTMSAAGIERRLAELEHSFQELFQRSRGEEGGYMKYADEFGRINDEVAELKKQQSLLLEQQQNDSAASKRISDAVGILNAGSAVITEWDESVIRQLVDTVKVLSEDRISVRLRGGMEIEQQLDGNRD